MTPWFFLCPINVFGFTGSINFGSESWVEQEVPIEGDT